MKKQAVNSHGEILSSYYAQHDQIEMFQADDGMARQEFADECDINVLMATYEKTGVLNHYNTKQPQYLDVTEVPDLSQALRYMDDAQAAFMSLPATVRREFDNDPIKFVDFASDPGNLDQMRKWGLAPPAPVTEPISEAPPKPVVPEAS